MKIFDLMNLEAKQYEQRDKNVFYQNELFKIRVINLKASESIPECEMDCFVLFYVIKGEVLLRKNDESAKLKENNIFITEPALLSMQTDSGTRLIGIQIKTRETEG